MLNSGEIFKKSVTETYTFINIFLDYTYTIPKTLENRKNNLDLLTILVLSHDIHGSLYKI